MYKSLLDVFSEKQMNLLRGRMWWVADRDQPYLMKFSNDTDYALLQLTNLKNLWVARIHIKTLLQDKKKYAKSLEIKENKDLMSLFQSLLTASDPLALYTFSEGSQGDMSFTFKKRIEIFDFNWVFKMQKVSCNPVELICRELISPLAAVLSAQSKRIELMKKRFEQVEKDYLRKMTEMQKNLYKSPLFQDKEDWLELLPKFQGRLLTLYAPDRASEFFFANLSPPDKKVEVNSLPLYLEHKNKPFDRIPDPERYELADTMLSEQIELERARQRKEKKIDFI